MTYFYLGFPSPNKLNPFSVLIELRALWSGCEITVEARNIAAGFLPLMMGTNSFGGRIGCRGGMGL
jgi:hypothetical protein